MSQNDINQILDIGTFIIPFIIIIILGFYLSQTNISGDIFNSYLWGLGILVSFLVVILFTKYFGLVLSKAMVLGTLTISVIVISIVMFLYQRISHYSYYIGEASNTIAFVLMILFGLAILFSILYSYTKYRTWTGFWAKMLFYLPCLILDAIVDISNDIGITPRPVLILFILEILLIVWYSFSDKISAWFQSKTTPHGIVRLQKTPMMLHAQEEIILANSEQFRITNAKDITTTYRRSYTISFWVFIHDNDYITGYDKPPEFNLFFYGSKILDKDNKWQYVDSKPRVTYTVDKNNSDTYLLYIESDQSPYKLSIANQKWNQFVFVYQDTIGNGHIDLFVNGYLVKSWESVLPSQFSSNDKIIIGDDVNKLYGSILGVTYYEYALQPHEVSNAFNTESMQFIS